jgi:hypothetical protein
MGKSAIFERVEAGKSSRVGGKIIAESGLDALLTVA